MPPPALAQCPGAVRSTCDRTRYRDELACNSCWSILPARLRDAVVRAYARAGGEGTAELVDATAAAAAWLRGGS
jgi:hypothetical protein